MKLLLAGTLAALSLTVAAPAMAQSIYVGPRGGVAVGLGVHRYGGYYGGHRFYGGRGIYEGRSVGRGVYDRGFRHRF